MNKKICSEVSLDNPYFKLKIGTINKKDPTTFYIEGGTFIMPVEDDGIPYKEKMSNAYRALKCGVTDLCHNLQTSGRPQISNSYLATIDVADERMKIGKKTYFSFQCFLKQDKNEATFSEIMENGNAYAAPILSSLEYCLKESGFALSKTKK